MIEIKESQKQICQIGTLVISLGLIAVPIVSLADDSGLGSLTTAGEWSMLAGLGLVLGVCIFELCYPCCKPKEDHEEKEEKLLAAPPKILPYIPHTPDVINSPDPGHASLPVVEIASNNKPAIGAVFKLNN